MPESVVVLLRVVVVDVATVVHRLQIERKLFPDDGEMYCMYGQMGTAGLQVAPLTALFRSLTYHKIPLTNLNTVELIQIAPKSLYFGMEEKWFSPPLVFSVQRSLR